MRLYPQMKCRHFWEVLPIFLITVSMTSYSMADQCEVLPGALQSCYRLIGMKIPQEDIPSILHVPINYIQSCGRQNDFLMCYMAVISVCPTYRQINPLMFDFRSIRAITQGICKHKEAYLDGLACAMNKSIRFTEYLGRCYTTLFMNTAVEAVKSGNWSGFCSYIDREYFCLKTVLGVFSCSEEFITLARHFVHSIIPPYCRDGSEKYTWLNTYAPLNGAKTHTGHIFIYITGLASVLYLSY